MKLQLGGRLEYTRYSPKLFAKRVHHDSKAESKIGGDILSSKSFLGFSTGIGARFNLWTGGALVLNQTNSYRAPALEELYNYGLHMGNQAFEVGNPNLKLERSSGLDFSFRHRADRIRGEVNFFYYDIDDFIFPMSTGEFVDDFRKVRYMQGDTRFVGVEFQFEVGLHNNYWLNLSMDMVDTKIKRTQRPVPRIPPLRARLAMDLRHGNLSLKPEIVLADSRKEIAMSETPTPGYAVINFKASYTIPQRQFAHHLTVNVSNISDRLYRNHLSFIKDLVPEMGRQISFSYVLKLF